MEQAPVPEPPKPVVEAVEQAPVPEPPKPVVEAVEQAPVPEIPKPVVEQHTPDIQVLWEEIPDPSVTVEQCVEYGYTEMTDLHPLRQDKALELFEEDLTIYALNQDNTETMIFEVEEIEEHNGLFAVEKTDWNKYCEDDLEEPVAEVPQQEAVSSMAQVKEENQAPMEKPPETPQVTPQEPPKPEGTGLHTVADLEEAVKQGQTISILDLAQAVQREKEVASKTKGKPSILAQLKEAKQPQKPQVPKETTKEAPTKPQKKEER